MTARLNALRRLDQLGIAYAVRDFPDAIHSADGVADHLGLPRAMVYKTLVALAPGDKPLLVMLAGDRTLDLKRLARALGVKDVRMAGHAAAERLTGLQTGGISPLALAHRPWPVYIDAAALALPGGRMLVSAGRRGVNVELAVADLVRATGAVAVDAAGSASPS